MKIELNRKRGSYGCVREGEGWDTCTVCNSDRQKECDKYMTCTKWSQDCRPEMCRECKKNDC